MSITLELLLSCLFCIGLIIVYVFNKEYKILVFLKKIDSRECSYVGGIFVVDVISSDYVLVVRF